MARTAREEWRAAWPIPVIGMVGMAGVSIPMVTAGVFMQSFATRFGWSRATFSSGLMVMLLLSVSLMPFVGRLVDRVGARRLAVIGVVVQTGAIAALGLANGLVGQWWLLCAVVAVAGQFVSPAVWTTATASLFETSRGLAMAVTLSGIGLCTAGAPLLATLYLGHFGASLAYPLLALTWGAVAIPLTLFAFHPGRAQEHGAVATRREGVAYRDAVTSRSFIMLCAAGMLFAIITYSMVVHLVPILRSHGIAASAAAAIMGLMGLAAMTGRLLGGTLLDRFPAKIVGVAFFVLPIASVVILMNAGASIWLSALAAIAFGLANGAEMDLISYLVARYYGMRNFAGIYAISVAGAGAAAALGPVIAGLLYDQAGSYDGFLMLAMVPMAIGAALVATLPTPPRTGEVGIGAVPALS